MNRIWNLEEYAGRTALTDEYGRRMTYGELNTESAGVITSRSGS